jgi:chromosome segregation ATPase
MVAKLAEVISEKKDDFVRIERLKELIVTKRQMMKHMTTQQNEAISQWNDAFQEQLAQSNEDQIKAEEQIAVHRYCCEGLQLQLSTALSDNKGFKSSIKYHEKMPQGHLAHIDKLELRNTTSDNKLRQCQDELKDVRSELGPTESAIKEFDVLKVKFKNCKRDLRDVRHRLGDYEATSQDTQNQWDSCDLTLAGKKSD